MEEEIRSAVEENRLLSRSGGEWRSDSSAAPSTPGTWAKEKAELEDLLRRRQAEFENFRRRVERERSDFAEYAGNGKRPRAASDPR